MAVRKSKKKQIDEGPFLFNEEEMLGLIERVSVIQSLEQECPKEEKSSVTVNVESEVRKEAEVSPDEPFSDELMVRVMTDVLHQMTVMDKSNIRRIAFIITAQCQQGLDMNKTYSVPVIQDSDITGYELAAWCYCTFVEAFPSMSDKLQLPYAEHYKKAKESLE